MDLSEGACSKAEVAEQGQISRDWALNAFLLKLAENTTDDELDKMKFLCSGKTLYILILYHI